MRTRELTGTLLVAALLGLAGCGSQSSTGEPPSATGTPTLFGDCRADDPSLEQAAVLADVDLDGSGVPAEVGWVPPETASPCSGSLVATLDGEVTALRLGDTVLEADSARVVQLSGSGRQLLLVHADQHPRGGYDLRLFGADEGRLGEALQDGRPLLGFVATDGGAAPATATCTPEGGIALFEARTHEPPGIVLAWDVYRTTYSLDGMTAVRVGEDQVRDGIADPTLRKEMPQLFEIGGHLEDCAVSS